MTITLNGVAYNVRPEAEQAQSIRMLLDEATVALYVAADKNNIDDYDVILLINLNHRQVFPLFLFTFNRLVESYYLPVIRSFPAFNIIEGIASDYLVADLPTISKLKECNSNKYVSYAFNSDTLVVAPFTTARFDAFGTSKPASVQQGNTEKVLMYVRNNPSKVSQPEEKSQPKPVTPIIPPIKPTPTVRPSMSQDHIKPAQTPVESPKLPITTPPEKPTMSNAPSRAPSRENLLKYCNITEDCMCITMSYNRMFAVVNKKTGETNLFTYDDILSVSFIGYSNDADLVKALGKTTVIGYDTDAVVVSDIRNLIRIFEQRKESAATKQMIAYDKKIVYVALTSEDALSRQLSIKNFAIESHKNANNNYNLLKERLKAYAKDVYLVLSYNNITGLIVSDNGKKASTLSIDEIYAAFPEAKNIGDIIRLFPIERIVNGHELGIENAISVRSVISVLPESFAVSTAPYYTVKNINFGYDAKNKVVMTAPIVKD